jgi:hypothetical protein
MALDRDKFAAAARAQGYTEKEIEAELGPAPDAVAPPSSADQATAKNDAEFAAGKNEMKADYDKKTKREYMAPVKVGEFETEIPSFFLTAPGLVTAGAAAIGAGMAAKKGYDVAVSGGKKLYGSLRDMMSAKKEDGLLANQQAEKAALAQSTPAEVAAQTKPAAGIDTSTDIGKPLSTTDTSLVKQGKKNIEKNIASQDVDTSQKAMAKGVAEGLPPPDLTTGTGKPAYAGQSDTAKIKSSYASPKDIPKDYAWIPGAQYIDTPRGNVGQETFTKEFTTRPYPGSYQESIDVSNEINRGLNRPTRDQLIAENKPFAKNTPGITKAVSKSKLIKVAGVSGALISMADLANAQTARGAIGNIAESFLPMGITPSSLASGELTPEIRAAQDRQMKELQKLGSPYRSVPPPKK